jgi:hypothetical protein
MKWKGELGVNVERLKTMNFSPEIAEVTKCFELGKGV